MKKTVLLTTLLLCFAFPGPGAPRRPKPRVLSMKATAYSQAGQPTAAGSEVREGIVAADPAVLPLGTRIRVSGAGAYDGFYIVTDTGRLVAGRQIDIYMPSAAEARKFGEKRVRVTVLEVGEGRKDAREKDEADRQATPPPTPSPGQR
jgi:rare lipoprotein A